MRALPFAAHSHRTPLRNPLIASVQILHLVHWRELDRSNRAVRSIANSLSQVGSRSFAWRLVRDENQASVDKDTNRSSAGENGTGASPAGLDHGISGCLLQACMASSACWQSHLCFYYQSSWRFGFRPRQKESDDYWIVIVLIGPLMITTIDSLMDRCDLLLYLLIAGALSRVPGNTLMGRPPAISAAASHLDAVCS